MGLSACGLPPPSPPERDDAGQQTRSYMTCNENGRTHRKGGSKLKEQTPASVLLFAPWLHPLTALWGHDVR